MNHEWGNTMKKKIIISLFITIGSSFTMVQATEIFINGFEKIIFPIILNDTGIVFSADPTSGNDATCVESNQDCFQGRDLLENNPSDGHAGFSFTKLAANGDILPANAMTHSCVRDNVTSLVWEVKTTTVGIHNQDNTYQWGGPTAIGAAHVLRKGEFYVPSWYDLVTGTNMNSLCGLSNWRVPNGNELYSIVNNNTSNPTIDSSYFPNTVSSDYWTSSPDPSDETIAWTIEFFYGLLSNFEKARANEYRVRLVSSGL